MANLMQVMAPLFGDFEQSDDAQPEEATDTQTHEEDNYVPSPEEEDYDDHHNEIGADTAQLHTTQTHSTNEIDEGTSHLTDYAENDNESTCTRYTYSGMAIGANAAQLSNTPQHTYSS